MRSEGHVEGSFRHRSTAARTVGSGQLTPAPKSMRGDELVVDGLATSEVAG